MGRVIDIRGTHGSGKSWLVHQVLEHYGSLPIMEDTIIGYELQGGINGAVLGRYSNVCGGCDGIKSADRVVELIRQFIADYELVILEGILVSHTFQRYHELAVELIDDAHDYNFCFLDTPKKICIGRVKKRRKEKGNQKEFNPANLLKDWHNIYVSVRTKMEKAGHDVRILPWRDPLPPLVKLIEGEHDAEDRC